MKKQKYNFRKKEKINVAEEIFFFLHGWIQRIADFYNSTIEKFSKSKD